MIAFATRAALVCVTLIAATTSASARETLKLEPSCPASHAACLVTELSLPRDGIQPSEYAPDPGSGDTAVLMSGTVTGRLRNGPRTRFTLKIEQDEFHIQAAFLGRSKANRPIVLTDRGPFEILTEGLDVGYGGTVAMIDMKTWRFAGEYLNDQDVIVSSPTDVGVWNDAARICIVAPTRKPGLLQITKQGCKRRLEKEPRNLTPFAIRTDDMRKLYSWVWPLPLREDETELVEAMEFGGDGGHFSIFRVDGTTFAIVKMIWDDC